MAKIKTVLAVSISLSTLCGAAQTFAQDTETQGTENQRGQSDGSSEISSSLVGELVVTARKREETLLDVPLVASVLSQDLLQDRQTFDLKDVASFVPGLSLSQTLGVSGVQVSLRGVGTSAQNAGIDASVALNIDGMQITQGVAYSSAMFDLERIEVLKGPQALFFGKNNPGGVISVRSADPTNQFELIAGYGYELEAEEHRSQFIVSGPVSESLALRLATQYYDQKGFFDNDAVALAGMGGLSPRDRNGPGGSGYIVRGTALWEPNAAFDARLKVNFTKDELTGGTALQLVSCPDGTAPIAPRNVPFLASGDCSKNRRIDIVELDPTAFSGLIDPSGKYLNETEQKYGTLELNFRPSSDITLTSVTGYYDLKFESQQSGSPSSGAGPGIASLVLPFTREDLTQELRLVSDFDGALNFTLGGFYQDGELFNHASLRGNTALGLAPVISDYEHLVDIESISAFGQVRYQIVPEVELAAGARWISETRKLRVWDLRTGSKVSFPTSRPKISSDEVSPEVTLSYKPAENITTFASFKKGFKSGSFNLVGPSGVLPDISFGDENVQGYEIGAKAQLLDGRLFTSIAFYDYDYEGLQVGVNTQDATGVPRPRTLNAGEARTYGVDFDVNYRPLRIDGLRLRASVLWNHARFTRLDGVPCWGGQMIADGCTQQFNPTTNLYTAQSMNGEPLMRAPDWQANFGFDYSMPFVGDMTLSISNTNQYASRYLAGLGLRDDFYQSSYFKSDLTLALQGARDQWEVALIGKNLGNKLTSGGCINFNAQNGVMLGGMVSGGNARGPAGVDEIGCYMDRGREIWVRLTVWPFR